MPNQEQYPYEIIEMTNKHAIPCFHNIIWRYSEGLVSGFLQFIIRPHFAYISFAFSIDWTICNLAKSSCLKIMALSCIHSMFVLARFVRCDELSTTTVTTT